MIVNKTVKGKVIGADKIEYKVRFGPSHLEPVDTDISSLRKGAILSPGRLGSTFYPRKGFPLL